jgi:hypothetical protein
MNKNANPRHKCAYCQDFSYLTNETYIHLFSKHFYELWNEENIKRLQSFVDVTKRLNPSTPLDQYTPLNITLVGYKGLLPTCILRKKVFHKKSMYGKTLEAHHTRQAFLEEADRILEAFEQRPADYICYKEEIAPTPLTPSDEKLQAMEKLIEKLMKQNNNLMRQVEVQEEQLEHMKKKTEDILEESQSLISRSMNRLAKHSIDIDDIPDYSFADTSITDLEAEIDDIDFNHSFKETTLEKAYPSLYKQIYSKPEPEPLPKPTPLTPKPTPLTPKPTPLAPKPEPEPVPITVVPAPKKIIKKIPKDEREQLTIREKHIFKIPTIDE